MQNALVCLCMSCVTGNVQLNEERTEVGCVDCEVEVKVHFNEWGCTVWGKSLEVGSAAEW